LITDIEQVSIYSLY